MLLSVPDNVCGYFSGYLSQVMNEDNKKGRLFRPPILRLVKLLLRKCFIVVL